MRSIKIAGLLLFLTVVLMVYAPPAKAEWPWGSASEPFPWLNYLKSLPHSEGVTLYVLTRHEQTIQSAARVAFLNSPVAKALGISDVVFVYPGSAQWPTYIQRGEIDVAWGGGPTLFNWLDQQGLLQPLDNKSHPEFNAVLYELSKIPPTYAGVQSYLVGSDGFVHWIGASLSSFGFTINRRVLAQYNVPAPQVWSDLGDPVYAKYLPAKPLVGIADPTTSTSNTRMFEIILQVYGWEKGWRALTTMAANAIIYGGSSDVRDEVIRGTIAAGTTIDFYGYTAMQQNPDCQYIIPPNQSIVNYDPIAIVKNAPHKVQAAAFVAWVLSEYGGQQVWLDPNINRLPANPRVFDTPQGAQRPDLKKAYVAAAQAGPIEFNETLSSMWVYSVIYYFKATLVNTHDQLQSTWAALAQAYLNGRITKDQFNKLVDDLVSFFPFKDPLTGQYTTFTLDYALKINGYLVNNTRVYQALMSEWTSGATTKYQWVYQELQAILAGQTPPPPPWSGITTQTTTTATTTTTTTTAYTTTTQMATTTTTTTTTTAPPATTPAQAPQSNVATVVSIAVVALLVILLVVYFMRRK
ncbi:extracellular solute-binding protein, family 1 [Thermogladius calderae 1633]|uniref:Extracellular solute-binding protein, family 1 n=1 Tax=Thermogladius calderae (strain DSM 22663 / VKM B-2946 / 1633) TaxID=1184251 RepID=I3TEZ2_THEC1|nr:ABC transporter substrate-binding protein [Thermogladius calderae]AFK51330.1 extracellular solute-binding protein, family 1 [Thermogladius calderae 1633]